MRVLDCNDIDVALYLELELSKYRPTTLLIEKKNAIDVYLPLIRVKVKTSPLNVLTSTLSFSSSSSPENRLLALF